MGTMLYNRKADYGCPWYCCAEFATKGGKTNRKHRQAGIQALRTREKRAWQSEDWGDGWDVLVLAEYEQDLGYTVYSIAERSIK